MYDSLLDHDLEDETTVVGDVASDLDDKPLDEDEDETDSLTVDDEGDAAETLEGQELDAESLFGGDSESWSDDPVRMYLTQMGEIPLLTRKQEIHLARKIEITRAAFRRKLLYCDYVIRSAVQGAAPRASRRAAVRPHGAGLGDRSAGKGSDPRPVAAQPGDARIAVGAQRATTTASPPASRTSRAERKAAWKRLSRRRCRAVLLVEELGLRTQRIEPMIAQLEQFSAPDRRAQGADRADKRDKRPAGRAQAAGSVEYRNILRATAGNAHQPAQPRR